MSPGDDIALKLVTDGDGVIWFADGYGEPCCSHQSLDTFFSNPLWQNPCRLVRVLGLQANVSLIHELQLRRQFGNLTAVELASPSICITARERKSPEDVLFRMRQCTLPASLGGWHTLQRREFLTYALAMRLREAGWVDVLAHQLLRQHPTWPALSFVRGVDAAACARLITLILDPRWYIATQHPDRTSRLESYLGLCPIVQARVTDETALLTDPKAHACYTVLAAWKNGEPPGVGEREIPENFLWRIWFAHRGGVKGDLRASQAFITYLRHAWLSAISPNAQADPLFDPAGIFKSKAELDAYASHVAARAG